MYELVKSFSLSFYSFLEHNSPISSTDSSDPRLMKTHVGFVSGTELAPVEGANQGNAGGGAQNQTEAHNVNNNCFSLRIDGYNNNNNNDNNNNKNPFRHTTPT